MWRAMRTPRSRFRELGRHAANDRQQPFVDDCEPGGTHRGPDGHHNRSAANRNPATADPDFLFSRRIRRPVADPDDIKGASARPPHQCGRGKPTSCSRDGGSRRERMSKGNGCDIGARHSGLPGEVSAAAMEPRRAQTRASGSRLIVQSRPGWFPVAGLARDGHHGPLVRGCDAAPGAATNPASDDTDIRASGAQGTVRPAKDDPVCRSRQAPPAPFFANGQRHVHTSPKN